METDTQVTTPTPDSQAVARSPTATSPETQQRPLTRRERGKPEFHPTTVYHSANPEAKTNEENLVDEDAVRLDYEFVLHGGREEVVRVKSQLILPMALALETPSDAEARGINSRVEVVEHSDAEQAIDCRPPLPQRPSSRDWAVGKNGV